MSESSSESLPESTLKPQTEPLTEVATATGGPVIAKRPSLLIASGRRFWWIPTTYFIPYLITYLFFAVRNPDDCLTRASRVGSVGLFAAALIYLIWLMDSKFGARQIVGQSHDFAAKTLVYLLALALWVSWFGVGIAMTMSYDQVNGLPQ
jgi:Mn2+/Fe2+ NRAMP family transporter